MKTKTSRHLLAAAILAAAAFTTLSSRAADPLPSWNDGGAKQAIIGFVEKVTTPGTPGFVPVSERIATFDNDGTLWCEQPFPVQLYFALDRVKVLAPAHPEWRRKKPFSKLLGTPKEQKVAVTEQELMEVLMATHTGMTTAEFHQIVRDWIATAKHPGTGRLFTEMVYQPMLEVLALLRANGFKNYIVSGGGIEFMRPWAETVYGIPPEQVIGSSVKAKFEMREGRPVLVRLPAVDFIDDKAGKPVGINLHIGRRPVAAFGNSRGDLEMLEYAHGGEGTRFGLLVLHDDAAREFAYGPARGLPAPALGAFPPELEERAGRAGWTVVSMKADWRQVFP